MPPLKRFGSPWNWVSGLGVKKSRMMGATGPRKKFDDVFLSVDTIHQRDGRIDRRSPDDSKDRAYA